MLLIEGSVSQAYRCLIWNYFICQPASLLLNTGSAATLFVKIRNRQLPTGSEAVIKGLLLVQAAAAEQTGCDGSCCGVLTLPEVAAA